MTTKTCSIDLCQKLVYAKDICKSHYDKSKRVYKWPNGIRPERPTCSVEGCTRLHSGRGFCRTHLTRYEKHGDPLASERRVIEGNTPEERFWAQVEIPADRTKCWIWTGHIVKKYGRAGYRGKRWPAHRLAWFLTFGVDPGEVLRHYVCDNPPCCNVAHMKDGTQTDNHADMVAKGRQVKGEGVHTAVLTEEQVLMARTLMEQGWTEQAVADLFGVTQVQMGRIKNRKAWKHI